MFRKHTRLKPALYVRGCYFITIVTAKRQNLLTGGFLKTTKNVLKDVTNRMPGWSVDTEIMMPDHVHLILQSSSRTGMLSDFVRMFKSLTYFEHRRTTGKPDKIWQTNYYERIIRDENELNAIREYIVTNPEQVDFDWAKINVTKPIATCQALPCENEGIVVAGASSAAAG